MQDRILDTGNPGDGSNTGGDGSQTTTGQTTTGDGGDGGGGGGDGGGGAQPRRHKTQPKRRQNVVAWKPEDRPGEFRAVEKAEPTRLLVQLASQGGHFVAESVSALEYRSRRDSPSILHRAPKRIARPIGDHRDGEAENERRLLMHQHGSKGDLLGRLGPGSGNQTPVPQQSRRVITRHLVPRPTPKQRTLARKLEHTVVDGYRIANPLLTVEAAGRSKLPLSLALSLLCQESYGGKNIWGGDSDPPNPHAIFTYGHDASTGKQWGRKLGIDIYTVTKAGYLAYKAERNRTKGEQGVGPAQLTRASLQNEADRHGGAWRPYPNMLVGFSHLQDMITNTYGGNVRNALIAYNAGGHARGPGLIAGEHYADSVLSRGKDWARALDIPAP